MLLGKKRDSIILYDDRDDVLERRRKSIRLHYSSFAELMMRSRT